MMRVEAVLEQMIVERSAAVMTEAEFEAIYRRTAGPLRSFICRISGDSSSADDILQEAYLRFLGQAPRDNEAHQTGWLYRTATNLVYDRWRRQRRDRGVLAEPAAITTPKTEDLHPVFDKLKPRERALLWEAYVEGSSHREIADRLGLSLLSVKVLLFRARKKLARLLEAA